MTLAPKNQSSGISVTLRLCINFSNWTVRRHPLPNLSIWACLWSLALISSSLLNNRFWDFKLVNKSSRWPYSPLSRLCLTIIWLIEDHLILNSWFHLCLKTHISFWLLMYSVINRRLFERNFILFLFAFFFSSSISVLHDQSLIAQNPDEAEAWYTLGNKINMELKSWYEQWWPGNTILSSVVSLSRNLPFPPTWLQMHT